MATKLYRGMKKDEDGKPVVRRWSRGLGVRIDMDDPDIPVDEDGLVAPNAEGMSVSPDTPENLPYHRRPDRWGGDGPDPVWEISEDELGDGLIYREEEGADPPHGFVEPSGVMELTDYEVALAATRDLWRECP
jgi:hypothetical protein